MALHNDEFEHTDSEPGVRLKPGWTALHSWIFLVIVAIGLLAILLQNRYHYLSPLGLGKAYRIDKLFGSIQEFDPSDGWISARLMGAPPTQMSGMAPSPHVGSQAVPMNMPAPRPGEMVGSAGNAPAEQAPIPSATERMEVSPGTPAAPEPRTKPAVREAPPAVREKPEMGPEERLSVFLKAFPDYGEEEYQLANDDLYPAWKKAMAPQGTWPEFVNVYREFINWWVAEGSPAESGLKLWGDFMATRKGN
jgi:hypothetical protein